MQTEAIRLPNGRITIKGRAVEYRVRHGDAKSRLRIRVGIGGVEVIHPRSSGRADVEAFVQAHTDWILDQLDRSDRLRSARRVKRATAGALMVRGISTPVEVDDIPRWRGSNRVLEHANGLVLARGRGATLTPAKTLENWLRRQARILIEPLVEMYARELSVSPGRIYVMNQKTKWGNCSRLRNLSFNWRLAMAPEHVLRYLVAHETTHLAVPDHSRKFWLTVQSVCPESERARQWLVANGHSLLVDLEEVVRRAMVDGA